MRLADVCVSRTAWPRYSPFYGIFLYFFDRWSKSANGR